MASAISAISAISAFPRAVRTVVDMWNLTRPIVFDVLIFRQQKITAMSSLPQVSGFSFSLFTPSSIRFGPRLGEAILKRAEQTEIRIQTPHFLTTTSRGVIPHLSRDHYGSSGIHWVNVPFESL